MGAEFEDEDDFEESPEPEAAGAGAGVFVFFSDFFSDAALALEAALRESVA